MKNIIYVILALSIQILSAQQTPGEIQKKPFSIVGATAHIGDGTQISNSIIVIENGKITACGNMDEVKPIGDIIDVKGQHVYPAFIAANTSLGLVEVDAVRASNDNREIGGIIPHVRSLIAYNTESKVVESMRPNGVLVAQISPKRGLISGTSSIVQLDAWNWEDAAIKSDDAIYVNWPNPFSIVWRRGNDPSFKQNKTYEKQIETLTNFVVQAKAYIKGNSSEINIPFEAMKGLFDGSKQWFVNVNSEKGIIDAIAFAKQHEIKNLVIVGGEQSYKVIELLKLNKIPVLLNHTHRLPSSNHDDYDLSYKLPKLLVDAGILVGIQSGAIDNFQTRNLPFYAGTAVSAGLSKDEALKLITSNTAKILGINNRLGMLKSGMDATLFVSKGDALDMRTNSLTNAYINGRKVSLETHQTQLWKRYSEKYKGEY